MQPPPTFDPWPVDLKNWFTDCQCAIIPDKKEHKCELEGTVVDEQIEARHEESDAVEDELELFVVIFVANFLSAIQNRHVNIS